MRSVCAGRRAPAEGEGRAFGKRPIKLAEGVSSLLERNKTAQIRIKSEIGDNQILRFTNYVAH
jgi:hypothetical protein